MKNIFKILFTIIISGAFFISCEEVETEFDALTKTPEAGAPYYLQFKTTSQTLETSVDETGELVDITKTITVALLGMPQSSDIVIPITVDPASTIESSMYDLSATSITIPAGKSSGSITLTAYAESMPLEETLNLGLSFDMGANNATASTSIDLELYRIKYCPVVLEELVGAWSGTDSWDNPTQVVTSIDGDGNFIINGIMFGWFTGWWGEVIITNTPLVVDVNLVTGEFTIAEQPYLTSTWNGAPQPAYGLSGSGKIDPCYKTMTIDYVFHQGGSVYDGTAWGEKFQEVISLN